MNVEIGRFIVPIAFFCENLMKELKMRGPDVRALLNGICSEFFFSEEK